MTVPYNDGYSRHRFFRSPIVGPQVVACIVAAFILFQWWQNPDQPSMPLAKLEGTAPRHGWFYVTDCAIDQSQLIAEPGTSFNNTPSSTSNPNYLFPIRAANESKKSPVKFFYYVEFPQNATEDEESGQPLNGSIRSLTPDEVNDLVADHVKFAPNALVLDTSWHAEWYYAVFVAIGGFVLSFIMNLFRRRPAG